MDSKDDDEMQGGEEDREQNMREVVDKRNIFESDNEDEEGETQGDEDDREEDTKEICQDCDDKDTVKFCV